MFPRMTQAVAVMSLIFCCNCFDRVDGRLQNVIDRLKDNEAHDSLIDSSGSSIVRRFTDRFSTEEDNPSSVIVSVSLEDQKKCETYCGYYVEALRRCPKDTRAKKMSLEKCIQRCVRNTSVNKNGTAQDFQLRDTLQCRQNHAIMGIKEGIIASSDHCQHAELAGKARCRRDARSMSQETSMAFNKDLYYNANTKLKNIKGDRRMILLFFSTLYLIMMRGRLWATYPWAQVDPPPGKAIVCDQSPESTTVLYRSVDGTCNNFKMPMMGAVSTPFVHSLPSSDPLPASLLPLPTPEQVAAIMKRPTGEYNPKYSAPFNQLCSAWIQYMTHDWFVHDNSQNATTTKLTNGVTHWWDGSQLYGSSIETQTKVRVPGTGKLLLDSNNELTYDPSTKLPITGFGSNFWVGLHFMHTLFAREHNYVVDEMSKRYPSMSADELFHSARLVVTATMAKIHTTEWTPTLLANPSLELTMYSQWHGPYKTALHYYPDLLIKRQPFKYILKNLEAPYFAIPKYTTEQTLYNTSFFITEEFVSVYRMHPLLPDYLTINDVDVGLKDLAFVDARELIPDNTSKTLLHTMATTPARALALQNYPSSLYNLEIPAGVPFSNPNKKQTRTINLAAIDIQRDRERGLPRYNDMRRLLLLEPYKSIDELTNDPTERDLLKSVYTDIEQVDLLVGSLADKERPDGFAFGVVPFHIFIVMASRRIFSDRFFQEQYTDESYTPFGRKHVNGVTFREVLARHFPEYAKTMPKNPFMNWKK